MSMNFWERTKVQIDNQKTTFRWIAEKLCISETTISGMRKNGVLPRVDQALQIAGLLGVSAEYLVTGKERSGIEIRASEMEIIKEIRLLTDNELKTVLVLVHGLAENHRLEDRQKQTAG